MVAPYLHIITTIFRRIYDFFMLKFRLVPQILDFFFIKIANCYNNYLQISWNINIFVNVLHEMFSNKKNWI